MERRSHCACKVCNCGLHNCPRFPGWPTTEHITAPLPVGKPWKMHGVSTHTADFTPKPIYPPVPPRPAPPRWASDKETTHHDHFRRIPPLTPDPCPPFYPPKFGGYKDTNSIYQSDFKKPPKCPASRKDDPNLLRGGHIFWN